jgi:hypothetical protein
LRRFKEEEEEEEEEEEYLPRIRAAIVILTLEHHIFSSQVVT